MGINLKEAYRVIKEYFNEFPPLEPNEARNTLSEYHGGNSAKLGVGDDNIIDRNLVYDAISQATTRDQGIKRGALPKIIDRRNGKKISEKRPGTS